MILLTLFVVFTVTGLLKYFLHMRRMESYVKHLPTMRPLYPFIGNAHFFFGKSTAELFSGIVNFVKENETPSKSYIGPVLNITLDKPEDIRTVLMSSSCLDKPYMYRFLPSTVGILTTECKTFVYKIIQMRITFALNTLSRIRLFFVYSHVSHSFFVSIRKAGAFWRPIRKLLNSTFNLKILQSFVPIFNDKTKIMLEILDKEAENSNFDLSKYMHACTLDMVCGML